MNTNDCKRTVFIMCLASLAPWLALAQPVITAQPSDRYLDASSSAGFSVQVSGLAPFSYQWLFDGVSIAGATNSILLLADARPAQSGQYSVIVSNTSGSVTSQVALLKVFLATPHGFGGIQVQSNGSVALIFKGETTAQFASYYDLYPVETSSNLVDWTPLVTLQRTNTALNALSFLDAGALNFSHRFYRTPTNQFITPDPQPTGPYAVGTFSMLLTNSSRNNARFMVTFWYPAVAQAAVPPAHYVEPQVALSGGYGSFANQVGAFCSHSLPNAPLAGDQGIYPVVLYDPGGQGHRRENTDKTEDLASWGFVVVGLDTSDTPVSVFPNGTVVDGQTIEYSIGALDVLIEGRLLDLQFVLDELDRLNTDDPRLAGRLDLDNVGAFGWSMGGATAAQLCLRDPRCKAGAGMDGWFTETNLLRQSLGVPYLFLRSDSGPDPDPVYDLPGGRSDDMLQVYNNLVTNAYWIKLISTVHGSFADPGLIFDSASLESSFGAPASGQLLPPARISEITRAYLLSFFNKFLQAGDDDLVDGRAYPEVLQFLSKSGLSTSPQYPSAALTLDAEGNLYGVTRYGGASNQGAMFQTTPSGALTTVVSFSGATGSFPYAGLLPGSDGNFYGTTPQGGLFNAGTVFQVTASGSLTTLVSFNGTNGSYPYAGLVQGSDGNFYGTTSEGGTGGAGTIFKITSSGVLTTLVALTDAIGAAPYGALVQADAGSFFGTTSGGGADGGPDGYGAGTVFKVTPAGAFTTMVSFSGTDGFAPTGLVLGSDGNFYGTTANGGNLHLNGGWGLGTVYKMTPAGALTTLVSFNGANGSFPEAGLVQGSDGNFYGTTSNGGQFGCGTVFKMTPAGALTTLVSFSNRPPPGP